MDLWGLPLGGPVLPVAQYDGFRAGGQITNGGVGCHTVGRDWSRRISP
ncbi:hypothetical protein Z946_2286 [Sulfitobacter noctilucicola]|nr:hypothetical protein Z946_2286 [Sulfitobacter noctilucicola]